MGAQSPLYRCHRTDLHIWGIWIGPRTVIKISTMEWLEYRALRNLTLLYQSSIKRELGAMAGLEPLQRQTGYHLILMGRKVAEGKKSTHQIVRSLTHSSRHDNVIRRHRRSGDCDTPHNMFCFLHVRYTCKELFFKYMFALNVINIC